MIGSLFSGYGGLDMAAATVFGGQTLWTADTDTGAARILAARFPNAPNLGDVTAVDWSQVAPVDILTAGWPCQPWSAAGQQKGTNDDRALWPEVTRAIRALRPRLVLLENVAAIAHLGELERATASLAGLGYVGSWRRLLASDAGAPHGRARIFIVATDPDQPRLERRCQPGGTNTPRRTGPDNRRPVTTGCGQAATDPDILRQQGIGGQLASRRDPNGRGGAHQFWGDYQSAIRRWEALTRPAPEPTELGPSGAVRLAPKFTEWMMGLPAGWVTDVHGLTYRQQLHALGNGVVPQQAELSLSQYGAQ